MIYQGIFETKADYVAYYCNIKNNTDNFNSLCEIALELENNNVVSFIPTDDNKMNVYLGE